MVACFLLLLCGVFFPKEGARGEMLWSAVFDAAGAGSKPVVDESGNNETLSALEAGGVSTLAEAEIRADAGKPEFMPGGALYVAVKNGTGEAGLGAFQIMQAAVRDAASQGVLVMSFDWYRAGGSGYSQIGRTRTAAGTRSGKALYLMNTPEGVPQRVTVVLNRSGADIMLPGELGALPTNSLAIYRYDGGGFTGVKSAEADITSDAVAGLGTGGSVSKLSAGKELTAWIDNMGLWNSVSDAVGGVDVLRLAPGTVPGAGKASTR